MGKRKRKVPLQEASANLTEQHNAQPSEHVVAPTKKRKTEATLGDDTIPTLVVQIVIGTYERILHGVTAAVRPGENQPDGKTKLVEFSDTFMFSAHGSSIRCVATSPTVDGADKVILASGGSDQAVNLYSLSTVPPKVSQENEYPKPALGSSKIAENHRNRELGSLQNHAGAVNAICFPTRSKMLSASDDSTIAIARTKDWTVLSSIKVPIPKAHGQASGGTAQATGFSTGVNDFAVHPSMKLMLSVGKGERCMRLWNLVTGKKAGVLNFDRDLLQKVGEGKFSSGEGRKVRWDALGEEFAIAFDRGCVLYGIDSKPKGWICPSPRTKLHQLGYISVNIGEDTHRILNVSTEDGRILFYQTLVSRPIDSLDTATVAQAIEPFAQLGGVTQGVTTRIKDFLVLGVPNSPTYLVVSGNSDGGLRLWSIEGRELCPEQPNGSGMDPPNLTVKKGIKQIGTMLGSFEAGNRITCLTAFIMTQPS